MVSRSWQSVSGPQFGEEYLKEYAPLFTLSPKMREVKAIVEQIADTNVTVLLRGESGAGKDLVARAIHAASSKCDQPFVHVNCAALPPELLESELFGHEKGAFTGAYRRKLGKFEFANKGAILLNEIGELPHPLQAKLLHVLQDFEFSRVGGREMIRVGTRILASTNRDLETLLQSGDFRQDLYYRLSVVEIRIPPLRERKEEIPSLTAYFMGLYNERYCRNVEFLPETRALFSEYSWPGNVRELSNVVRRLVVLGNPRQVHEEFLKLLQARSRPGLTQSTPEPSYSRMNPEGAVGLREIARGAAEEAERRVLAEALDRVHWNRAEAARILKVSYKTLRLKVSQYGLTPSRSRRKS